MSASRLPMIVFAAGAMIFLRPSSAQTVPAGDPNIANRFTIGQTIALSGSLAEHGNAVVLDARSYFDFVNARGGIRGRRTRLGRRRRTRS